MMSAKICTLDISEFKDIFIRTFALSDFYMKSYVSIVVFLLVFGPSLIRLSAEKSNSDPSIGGFRETSTIQRMSFVDSVLTVVDGLNEEEYAVPFWTSLCKARKELSDSRDNLHAKALLNAVRGLKSGAMPYDVVMSFHGDPMSRLGFAWYTNQSPHKGCVQLVKVGASDSIDFTHPDFTFQADTLHLWNVNYSIPNNDLYRAAHIRDFRTHSYTSHKALAIGLEPNATYRWRVGRMGCWSDTGRVTTAPYKKDAYSFLYTTDTQANCYDYFDISRRTLTTAKKMFPHVRFCLSAGDMIESPGLYNSEWEWEQFLESMKSVWTSTPLAPMCGAHDKSVNKNFTHHFPTETIDFDRSMSISPGAVYSFVYGDALFLALSNEEYGVPGYLDSLKNYVRKTVNAHPTIKWKIAFYHKNIYTGSYHQDDPDIRLLRENLAPLFDEVGIDLALQGHDHVYEVIGPVREGKLVSNRVSQVRLVPGGSTDNMNGKEGGIFDVKDGTLYFLNDGAGVKKYEPLDKASMEFNYSYHLVADYWSLFTGKFGQPGQPTFSEIKVSSDSLFVSTYVVPAKGEAYLYDAFKVIKSPIIRKGSKDRGGILLSYPASDELLVTGVSVVEKMDLYSLSGVRLLSVAGTNRLHLSAVSQGSYLLKIYSEKGLTTKQVLIP